MKMDPGSDGWYYDERTHNFGGGGGTPGDVWTYGKEVWCNAKGQYVHIVADLSHLMPTYPSYYMSLCSVGIMGTSFTRNETLTPYVELA